MNTTFTKVDSVQPQRAHHFLKFYYKIYQPMRLQRIRAILMPVRNLLPKSSGVALATFISSNKIGLSTTGLDDSVVKLPNFRV